MTEELRSLVLDEPWGNQRDKNEADDEIKRKDADNDSRRDIQDFSNDIHFMRVDCSQLNFLSPYYYTTKQGALIFFRKIETPPERNALIDIAALPRSHGH